MSGFKFENQGAQTYLVYEVGGDDVVDSMSLGMLTNNKIPGLAQTIFTQMDRTKYIKYNVSAKISVDQLFSRAVRKKRLLDVLGGIANGILAAEDYMIDPDMILLDQKYIFSDVSSGETVLICVPAAGKESQPVDLGVFFRDLVLNTRFDQTENCDYVARILNYLNSAPAFSTQEFKKLLDTIRSDQGPQSYAPVQAPVMARQPGPAVQPAPAPAVQPAPGQGRQPASRPAAQPAPEPVNPAPAPPAIQSRQMQAPPMPVPPRQAPGPAAQQAGANEKPISLFYLLQHYNKENAAAYKAQKAKKEGKAQPAPKPAGKPEKASKKKRQNSPGFAVPGAPCEPAPAAPQPVQPAYAPQPAQPAAYVPQQAQTPYAPQPAQQPYTPQRPVPQPAPAAAVRPADFGDTCYISVEEDSATMLLGQEGMYQPISPYLIRRKNHEKIVIDQPIFRLGRDAEFNDYAIVDNKYIGHCHCHIVTRDGEHFILDDNSKNHTAVNGVVITPGTEVKIAHEYIIKLADEEFEFRLF